MIARGQVRRLAKVCTLEAGGLQGEARTEGAEHLRVDIT